MLYTIGQNMYLKTKNNVHKLNMTASLKAYVHKFFQTEGGHYCTLTSGDLSIRFRRGVQQAVGRTLSSVYVTFRRREPRSSGLDFVPFPFGCSKYLQNAKQKKFPLFNQLFYSVTQLHHSICCTMDCVLSIHNLAKSL